jgi:hypothetical protein
VKRPRQKLSRAAESVNRECGTENLIDVGDWEGGIIPAFKSLESRRIN